MSFKVSNIRFEESRRVVDEELSSKAIETISAAATSDPYIATTQIFSTTTYTITLPNAEPGTIKVMTFMTSNETSVTVNYNNGFNGDLSSVTFGYVGELVIFYASANGWHTRTFLD